MRNKNLLCILLILVLMLIFSAQALAVDTSPHSGYGAGTNFCLACHDVHEAQGDYVLSRQATITALCGTCHGLFGATQGSGGPAGTSTQNPSFWAPADNPPAMTGETNATASALTAYKVNQLADDTVPGHSLGIMYGGAIVRNSDTIPGASTSNTLKLITGTTLYHGEAATSKNATKGLYCASCHTPHSGQMIPNSKLLSSKPNHTSTAVTSYDLDHPNFCISCHDRRIRNSQNTYHNHPSEYCLYCHGNDGSNDFPHTGVNQRILVANPDGLCTANCHNPSYLP